MKRVLVTLLGLSLMFVFACKRPGHVKTQLIARTGEKTVTIAISDNGSGGYTLEASLPNKAYLKKGQHRVHWIVINNTQVAIVNSVVIDGFHDSGSHTDPFEGTAEDQKFEFPTIGVGDESSMTSNKAKRFPPGAEREFKYKVTVRIAGVGTPITVDPVVVVGD